MLSDPHPNLLTKLRLIDAQKREVLSILDASMAKVMEATASIKDGLGNGPSTKSLGDAITVMATQRDKAVAHAQTSAEGVIAAAIALDLPTGEIDAVNWMDHV